jgi:hypothetical protein
MRILAAKHRDATRLTGGLLVALVAAALCAGCGQASTASSTTIRLTSPGVEADGVVSPKYSCGLGTIWLPLKWGDVPSGTEELFLYFGRFKRRTVGRAHRLVVPFAALIRKLKPSQHGYAANAMPANEGFGSFRSFNSCPPVRKGQHMLVELLALPRHRGGPTLTTAFVTGLTEAALEGTKAHVRSMSARALLEESLATGHFTAIYGQAG